jgi:DNA polymerase-3 subunit delta'
MPSSVFDDLVGQEQIVEVLQGAVSAARLSNDSQVMTHAWIFTGPPGSGRSSAAIAFALALICSKNGCGTCRDCHAAKTNGHPDVELFLSEGMSIKVDEVRELLSRVTWAPSMSDWRVVVMEDADRLTEPAANALLKAIEEPGNRTVWLLCAPTLHDVLPTIRSRCRHLQLHTPSLEAVANTLVTREHIEPKLAKFAARVSEGHIGRAKYFATNEHRRSNRKIILQLPLQLESLAAAFRAAQKLLELATSEANASTDKRDAREIEKLQEAYGNGATGRGMASGAVKAVKELEREQKARSSRMVRDCIDGALLDITSFYRDVMMVQIGKSASVTNIDILQLIEGYAEKSHPHAIVNKINAIMDARIILASNAAPLLTCEALFCRLAK